MYKKQELTKFCESSETSPPAMVDFNDRLQNAVNRFDVLTIELKRKLQIIKRIDEPPIEQDEVKENQPNCVMDELNCSLWKINDFNERLESCLHHLNLIV